MSDTQDLPFVPEEFVKYAMDDVNVRYWEWQDSGRLDVELEVSFGDVSIVLYLSETGDGDVDLRFVEVEHNE